MKNNEIPIFFTVDNNYLPFLAVTLKSIIENHKSKEKLAIKILHTDVNDLSIVKIKKLENKLVQIDFIDVSEFINKIKRKLFTRDYYSCTTYYRLFIPEIFPEYDKAVYLDSDVVLLKDISNFYYTNIGDNLIGAAPDDVIQNNKVFQEYAEKVVGVKSYKNYFNAGVLLMNLKELRKINFKDKFLYLLEHVRYSVAQDQDYLNHICKGRVTLIPNTWDRMPIGGDNIPREELNLIHYNLHLKPWHYKDILYEEYFWKYAKKTEYYNDIMKISRNYTDKERELDELTYQKLKDLAQFESDCVGDDR